MTPADFNTFFAASSGAAAALVGLLFVSVSIAPDQTITAAAPAEQRAVAGSTFTALLNALFVSLGALIPGGGLGGIIVLVSLGSLTSSLGLSVSLLRGTHGWLDRARAATLIAGGLAVYAFQLREGIALTHNPADIRAFTALTQLILGAYGLGMIRAWELLGAESYGLHRLLHRDRNSDSTDSILTRHASNQDEAGVSPSQRS